MASPSYRLSEEQYQRILPLLPKNGKPGGNGKITVG